MSQKHTYTEAELAKAFGVMGMHQDWQGRICAEVKATDTPAIVAAIEFYTGCEAQVYPVPSGRNKLMAAGYRKGPWKDKVPEKTPH